MNVDATTLSRIVVGAGVALLALELLAKTALHYRRTGSSGNVIAQAKRGVERVVGFGMTAVSLGVALWGVLYAWLGPGPLQVWVVSTPLAAAGALSIAASLALIVAGHVHMGAAWRMGIDQQRTELVTSGPFRFVRNPVYAGTVLFDLGLVLASPSPWTISLAFLGAMMVSLQARLEEEHLIGLHAAEYLRWARSVGRFLPGVGLLDRERG